MNCFIIHDLKVHNIEYKYKNVSIIKLFYSIKTRHDTIITQNKNQYKITKHNNKDWMTNPQGVIESMFMRTTLTVDTG